MILYCTHKNHNNYNIIFRMAKISFNDQINLKIMLIYAESLQIDNSVYISLFLCICIYFSSYNGLNFLFLPNSEEMHCVYS